MLPDKQAMFGLTWILLSCHVLLAKTNFKASTIAPTTILELSSVESSTLGHQEPSSPNPKLPVTEPVADVCNLSLITSEEGPGPTVSKKCACKGEVDCSNLDIIQLPLLISFPKDVHVGNFENNKISSLNKDTFYNGRGITDLDFSYNLIDFVSANAFNAFPNLKKLDLSHNRLWNIPSNTFQGLVNLKRLDLSFNDLINVFPELFTHLSQLRELYLKSNPIEELSPRHFEHLEHLEKLDLEATLLKIVPDNIFVFTPKLRKLNLAGNRLTEIPTNALKDLDSAKVLDLSGNPIEVIEMEAFKGMRGLVILYLNQMPSLTKIQKYAFGDLVHLEELHLSYNFLLSHIDDRAFVRKMNGLKVPLSQLFLRQDALTAIPKSLLDWSDEVELHLQENPLHCDCKTQWMVDARLKNNFQSHVSCATPPDLENILLNELESEELTCGLQISEAVLITCAVVTGILVLVLIIAFLMWRRSYAGYSRPQYASRKYINDMVYSGGDDGI